MVFCKPSLTNVLILSLAVSFIPDLVCGGKSSPIRGLRIPKQKGRHLAPKKTFVQPVEGNPRDTDFYQFDVDGVLHTDSPSQSPSAPPSNIPTDHPSPRPSTVPTDSPTKSPSNSPTEQLSNSPREPATDSPTNSPPSTLSSAPTDSPTKSPITDSPTGQPSHAPTQSPSASESRIMEEVVQAQEQGFLPQEGDEEDTTTSQRDPNTSEGEQEEQVQAAEDSLAPERDVDPTDADQFLPARDPTYYYVDLRPFSVFVDADRDLTSDLGIPLYLLLEMAETIPNLVDIKITNLTIHMGVVQEHVRHRRMQANHYHWNQLFFNGLAQLDDSTEYPPVTVRNVQSLVLSDENGLQEFWENEGYGDTYSNLELRNITLLPFPVVEEELSTVAPTPVASEMIIPEDSKRDSNIWIMVPLVIVFMAICFCIICLAGRLQYLASRAQDKYNEKYGLDYNIYDKDISKDIFKEEYLMSEHHEDQEFPHAHMSDSVRSIDFLTKPIGSIKAARRSSKQRNPPPAPEEHSTEDEEDDIQGGFTEGEVRKVISSEDERNAYYFRNGPMASAVNESRMGNTSEKSGAFPSSGPRIEQNVVVDEGIVLPKPSETAEDADDGPVESVPPDEDVESEPKTKTASKGAVDEGDTMPTMIKFGGTTMPDASDKDESARSVKSRDSATFAQKEKRGMGNSSGRDRSGRYQRNMGSFNSTGDDKGVIMGNSSRGSRGGDRSRFNRSSGSFGAATGEDSNAMGNSGRGDRSTRSSRSLRSVESASSVGSFYSCQGDLV